MGENQRTLHVTRTVQPRGQTEMALEEGAHASEPIEDCIRRYSRHPGEYTFCTLANIQPPPFVILKSITPPISGVPCDAYDCFSSLCHRRGGRFRNAGVRFRTDAVPVDPEPRVAGCRS